MEFRALIIDDEETYSRALMRLLARRGIAADHAPSCAEGMAALRRGVHHLVLLDYLLPDGNGLDMIRPIRAAEAPPLVLMMTAFGTIENAVEAMRRGAFDYLTKSTAMEDVVRRVTDARRILEAQARSRQAPDVGREPAADLMGESPAMREARARLADVARSPDTTVLLTGESGTGKGVAARLIHARGARPDSPFVAIDCVALPPSLAESELFGHEKGAFTGADRQKIGKLEAAGAGTVLLDEIGDMEAHLQGKLLRVLEERSFERVGGLRPVAFAARVVAASHRDLGGMVREGRFRLDLFHRLSVFPVSLPPLRERGDDVLRLADHFVAEFGARLGKAIGPVAGEVAERLRAYDFPGNVRELKNIVERAVILAADSAGELTPDLLPPRLLEVRPARAPLDEGALSLEFRPGQDTLEDIEDRLLDEAMRLAGGKKGRAAELLGISRFALLRRLEKRKP